MKTMLLALFASLSLHAQSWIPFSGQTFDQDPLWDTYENANHPYFIRGATPFADSSWLIGAQIGPLDGVFQWSGVWAQVPYDSTKDYWISFYYQANLCWGANSDVATVRAASFSATLPVPADQNTWNYFGAKVAKSAGSASTAWIRFEIQRNPLNSGGWAKIAYVAWTPL